MKKKAMIAVVFVGVLFAGLCFLSSNPIISCKIDIPESYSEAIEAQAKGVYSRRLPLIPVCATVDSFSGNEVHYTIHYFPHHSLFSPRYGGNVLHGNRRIQHREAVELIAFHFNSTTA